MLGNAPRDRNMSEEECLLEQSGSADGGREEGARELVWYSGSHLHDQPSSLWKSSGCFLTQPL